MTENTEKNPSLQVEHLGKQNHWWHSPNMILGSLLPLLTLVILTGQTIIFWQQKDLMGRQTQILEQQTRIQLNQTSPYISMDVKVLNNQIIAKTKNNNGIARRLGVVSIDCALGSTVFPKQNAYKLLNCIPEDIESIVLNGQEIVISFNENLRKIWDLYKLTDEFGSKKLNLYRLLN